MARYAENTEVSVESSKAEIERILRRYGADGFMYGWKDTQAVVGFEFRSRMIRLVLRLPDKHDERFTKTPSRGWDRTERQAEAAWEQACRQAWRALALVIKAKLEAVESGIATFEDEFLAYTVLPGGRTVSEEITPRINEAFAAGKVPALLPSFERQG